MVVNHVSWIIPSSELLKHQRAPGIGITIGSMAFLWCPVWTVKYISSRLGDFDIPILSMGLVYLPLKIKQM